MNLVLIGYRGTGKSTVARLLGVRFAMDVASLDAEVVREAGSSIPAIVAAHGWPHFRNLEAEITRRAAARADVIIDTGGGVVLRADNVESLRTGGKLFWLQASVPVIVARIEHGIDRPALTSGKSFTEEVEELLRERTPLYAAAADYTIDTDALTAEEAAAEVARLFETARQKRD
jgi:shikimate kinase